MKGNKTAAVRTFRLNLLAAALLAPTSFMASAQEAPDGTAPSAPSADTTSEAAPPTPQAYADTVPVPVAPAEATPAPERAASASRLVEEIVVTAQKREENLQSVPISIAAFSGAQLDARGLDSVKNLSAAIPALQISDFAGYSLIYIRGVGTDSFFPSADSSVATYIDGVFFPAGHTLGEAFGKVKRVEVLKGPQGTLFGRNATGGAINIITEDPSFNSETSVKASYGRFNDLKTRAYTNIPVTDWLAVNVSGIYNRADSDYTRDATAGQTAGQPLAEEITRAARLKVRIQPTDDIDVVLSGIISRAGGPGSALSVNTMPSEVGSLLGIKPETRQYVTATDTRPNVDNATDAYYGTLTWKLPIIDVKLLGSNFKVNTTNFAVDFDGSPQPLVTSTGVGEFQKNDTAELQLVSNAGSPGADWLQYTAGGYFYESKGGYNPVELSLANSAVTLPTGQLVQLVPQGLLALLGPIPAPSKVGALLTGIVGARSYSGYLQVTAKPTDWLGITLGGRYQKEQRSLIESTIGERNLAGGDTHLVSFPKQEDNRRSFAPKASIDMHLSDDILFYLSYQKGYKSSTYNVVNVDQPPSFVKPETVTAYEVGLKSQLFNHNLTFNAAAFQNDIKDLQASFVSLFSGGLAYFLNVGKARVRGVEFDVVWVPMPDLNPGLVATGGASILDPKYIDYTNAFGYNEQTGFFTSGNNYDGNQIVRTAKFTSGFGLSQTIETDIGPFEIGADMSYNSGYYFQPSNYSVDHQPAYAVVNARVSYLYEPWDLRLTAFGANLADKRYDVSQFRTDFGRLDTLAPPITYGGSVTWNF